MKPFGFLFTRQITNSFVYELDAQELDGNETDIHLRSNLHLFTNINVFLEKKLNFLFR